MPWLTNTDCVRDMVAGYQDITGSPIDTWWQEEDRLRAYWELHDWPIVPSRDLMYAVPCGSNAVAWIGIYNVNHDLEACIWTLIAFSEPQGTDCLSYDKICLPTDVGSGRRHRLPDNFFTQYKIRKQVKRPVRPAIVGEPCACRTEASPGSRAGGGKIGIVASIDHAGRILTVITEPGGEPINARLYANRWFALRERDMAFEARWKSGRCDFNAYIAMLGALAREEKHLRKKAMQPVGKKPTEAALGAVQAGAAPLTTLAQFEPPAGPVAYPIGPGEWRPVPIGNVGMLMEIWQQNRHCEICTIKWGVFDPAHPSAPSKRLS